MAKRKKVTKSVKASVKAFIKRQAKKIGVSASAIKRAIK
jgi:hypothetical protein